MERALHKELEHIVRVISNTIDAFTTALFVMDRHKRSLRLIAYCTLSENLIPGSVIRLDEGLIGWIAKNKKPVNIARFHTDATTLRFYSKDEDIKSFMAVPVGEFGVLSVDSKKRYDFTDKDQKILMDFAHMVVNVLNRSRRLREDEEQSSSLNLFHKLLEILLHKDKGNSSISRLLQEGSRQFEARLSALALEDATETRYEVVAAVGFHPANLPSVDFPVHNGLVGWVFKNGVPLILPSIRPDASKSYLFSRKEELGKLDSLLAIPLKTEEHVFGVLLFCGAPAHQLRDVVPREMELLGRIISLYLDQQRMAAELKRKESVDPITGFTDLSGLFQSLHNLCGARASTTHAMTLFRVNIVDFPLLGFKYPYPVADQLLQRVARILREVFGAEVQMAHGGEGSFAILAPGRNPAEVQQLRKLLIAALSTNVINISDVDVYVHFSVGFAMFPSDARTPEELWGKAGASFEHV
ncbi:MAG: GAF domain-containing protein [Deltaproteobacteria bacterium]|nr:GAF domain-containing protein [Deltaproteobacteria bacterium]